MRETKAEAKTIQDAVEKGLAELGLRRDQVEVVVISEGKSGFLGIGAKKACVQLREKRWGSDSREGREGRSGRGKRGRRGDRGGRRSERGGDRSERSSAPRRPGRYGYEDARLPPPEESPREERPRGDRPRRGDRGARRVDRVYTDEALAEAYMSIEPVQDPVEHAKTTLLKLLSLMGFEATVTDAKLETTENLLTIKFDCADSAVFTAENGKALQSLQFVLNTIVSRKREPHLALRLDTGGYWEKKEQEISRNVENAVEEARRDDKPYRMDPMPASMRKMVHNLIKANYPDMETVSEGEGRWRKVVVRKAEKPQEPQAEQAEQAPEPRPVEAAPEQAQPEQEPKPEAQPQAAAPEQPSEEAAPEQKPQPEQQPSEPK